ncbi:hypothetical protein ACJZTR_02560 [Neorickettsia risticii]|uniref:Uncharacterized protein n=1 Tax=Neorickettsia risticii (strain Illinois) TaxID=434131 RepID=C6V5A1_NEORI|nr:hypothetical protein [Neorickettsia risticii]ACT69576.1 conserved hypothetical protein [Neorickettsia risticii str. Illinois]
MSEIIKKAFEDIDEITTLLHSGEDVTGANQVKDRLLSLEKKVDEICRLNLSENLKLELVAALKKLLKRVSLSNSKK